MASWGFPTTHARVRLCIAHDPDARLRDIAATLGVTERRAHGIVTDLTQAGYLIRQKDGRRNRYQVQAHLPLPGPGTRDPRRRDRRPVRSQGRPHRGGPGDDADASGIRQAQTPDLRPAGRASLIPLHRASSPGAMIVAGKRIVPLPVRAGSVVILPVAWPAGPGGDYIRGARRAG